MTGKDRAAELAAMVRAISEQYRPNKIILFGSSARGAGESGDVDLVVIKETDQDPWTRIAEVDALLSHAVPVDVLVYTPLEVEERLAVNDFFMVDIVQKGVVLYERRV